MTGWEAALLCLCNQGGQSENPLCHVLSLASRLIPAGPHGQDCHCPSKPQGEEPCIPTCLCLRLKYTIESPPSSTKHMKPARILCCVSHSKCPFFSCPVFVVSQFCTATLYLLETKG